METKRYLGDSVYAEIDRFGAVVLTTENGYLDDPRNVIVLEPEVLVKLKLFLDELWIEHAKKNVPNTELI